MHTLHNRFDNCSLLRYLNALHLCVRSICRFSRAKPQSEQRILILSAALLLCLTSAKAQTSDAANEKPSSAVTVQSLVKEALENSPELISMRREFDAARARIPQATAFPDPVIGIGNVNVGSPIPFLSTEDGFNENFYISFTQELPWFGVRRLRGLTASAEAEAKFQDYLTAKRKLAAEVKIAAYDLYYIDRSLSVIKRDVEILDNLAKAAEARYAAGKAQQADVINARLEIAELIDKQGALEANRLIVAASINNLLFRDPETEIGEIEQIKLSQEPPALDRLTKLAFENAPELARNRRLIDAGNHSLRLAERESKYPEVGLNFVYHNRPVFDDYYTYGITFKLPLYSFKKQRYGVQEESSNLAAARARLSMAESAIRYRLRDAHLRALTALRLLKLLEQGIIPQAALALESSIAAYQTGQIDFLTVLTALKRGLDYETRYYERLIGYQKALAEMESFVGIELTK